MGAKTKIDWCDSSWNPVTGCLHGCEYCYARRIAERFSSGIITGHDHLYMLDEPFRRKDKTICVFPYGFDPTFHRYRLDIPQTWKKARNIFVCSMADLFGEWVPDEWIKAVFEACEAAPQHRYLFLTKNPQRYLELAKKGAMPDKKNFWYGCSVTYQAEPFFFSGRYKTFASIEPILEPFGGAPGLNHIEKPEWVIVGAETGNRKNKIRPEKSWINGIIYACKEYHIPLFMKESLRELMGDDFRQEFPWKEDDHAPD